MGIIEQWGTGLLRMIQGCREYGVHEQEFIDMGVLYMLKAYMFTDIIFSVFLHIQTGHIIFYGHELDWI